MFHKHALPTSEPKALRGPSRRTKAIRCVLAISLAAALGLAVAVARQDDRRPSPLVRSGTPRMVVIDLSASVYEAGLSTAIERITRSGGRAGLVAFSDAAYELLPPGTPARELVPLLRYFRPGAGGPFGKLPPNPWTEFRAGTGVSAGLRVARTALLREHVPRGSGLREATSRGAILLVSDLQVLPDEIERLAAEIARLQADGISLRVIPLSPTAVATPISLEERALMEWLTVPSALLQDPGTAQKGNERSLRDVAPWTFVLVAAVLVVMVAVNERMLSGLEVRP